VTSTSGGSFPGFDAVPVGARFYRADLHIHSYGGSSDVTDEAMTPAAIVAQALQRGISLIALTDHNSITNVGAVLEEAEKTGGAVVAVPGVEVTTSDGHVLVYCAPDRLDDLERWLNSLKWLQEDGGERYTRTTIDGVAQLTAAFGSICIPAHVGRKNTGFLTKAPHHESQAIFECREIRAVELDLPEHAAWFTPEDESEGHEQRAEYLQKRHAAFASSMSRPALARVLFSDAHDRAHIGKTRDGREKLTRFKMDTPSFEGLRAALLDPDARVVLEEPLPDRYPRIVGIRYIGGFLDGQEIAFAPNLTALIGGRGAGKSTALEALRCGCTGSWSEISGSDAWPESVQIEYVDPLGQAHLIQRDAATGAAYEILEGEAVPIDVPLEGYEQDRVADIIRSFEKEPLKLLMFFDQYLDTGSVQERLEELTDELDRNAEALLKVYNAPKELATARDRLKAVKNRIKVAEQSKAREALEFRRTLNAERQVRDTVRDELATLKASLEQTPTRLDLAAIAEQAGIENIETAAARTIMAGVDASEGEDNLRDLLAELASELASWRQAALSGYDAHRVRLDAVLARWDAREKRIEGRIQEIVGQLRAKGINPDLKTLNSLANEESQTQALIVQLARASTERVSLLKERDSLLKQLRKEQERLTTMRTSLGKRLAKKFAAAGVGFDVGIKFKEGEVVDLYESWLRARIVNRFFRGERVADFCRAIHPIDLAADVRVGRADRLLSLRDQRSATFFANKAEADEFIAMLAAAPGALFEAEALLRADRAEITLTVKDGTKTIPVKFKNLSFGQKAAILLGVVLFSDGLHPLVIDQPEDHLDSAFIYETVVRTLRQVKERRQVIVATHNANIAILGDAELLVPLRSWAGKGLIQDRGSVDGPKTRAQAVKTLEGGVEAYRRRGEMYGLNT
jgi:hypothetical protein